MARQALGGQKADEAKEGQPSRADSWWIWADRLQAVCHSSQPHQLGGAGVCTDHNQLQETAAAATAHQHPRHTEHAGASRQVLCRDMLSEVCQRQPTALERTEADLIKEFAGLKLNLRQGFVSTGMGDLQSKLLTVAEAKKRKAGIESQSRKQQKLLQA